MSEGVPQPVEPPEAAPARCRCGTDRESRFAVPQCQYGFWGAFYLSIGGTPVPTAVTFRCVKCGTVFDRADDRATRYRHR